MIRLKPKKKIPKSEAYWQTLAFLQKARLAAKKKVGGRFGSLFGIKVEKYPPQKKNTYPTKNGKFGTSSTQTYLGKRISDRSQERGNVCSKMFTHGLK